MNDNEVKSFFGKKVKFYREKIKLSQEELSVKLELNQRQVSMIERGLSLPSLKTLNKLSQVFECNIQDLFDNDALQSEAILKDLLSRMIKDLPYKKLQTLYMIAKNL